MGAVEQLVGLLSTQHCAFHEHLIIALYHLITENERAQAECHRPEFALKSLLLDRKHSLQGKEEFQVCSALHLFFFRYSISCVGFWLLMVDFTVCTSDHCHTLLDADWIFSEILHKKFSGVFCYHCDFAKFYAVFSIVRDSVANVCLNFDSRTHLCHWQPRQPRDHAYRNAG